MQQILCWTVHESGSSQSIEKAGLLERFNEEMQEAVGQPCTSLSVQRQSSGAIATFHAAETIVMKSGKREESGCLSG
jgi:hypothetical protein